MSRTIRRRKVRLRGRDKMQWVRVKKYTWIYVPSTPEELKEKLREFRMESYDVYYSPPSWFTRELNRLTRAREKQESRRVMVNGLYEEYSYKPRRRNAKWLWI